MIEFPNTWTRTLSVLGVGNLFLAYLLILYWLFEEDRLELGIDLASTASELPSSIQLFAYVFLSFLIGEVFFFMGSARGARPQAVRQVYLELIQYFRGHVDQRLETRFAEADNHANLLYALTYAVAFGGLVLTFTNLFAFDLVSALSAIVGTAIVATMLFTSAHKAYDAIVADCRALRSKISTANELGSNDMEPRSEAKQE